MTNFEQAAALDIEKWLQTLPEEAPEYKFSEKYNKFRVKLFDKMRGEKYHRLTKRATVAIIVAAILFAMAVATLAATVGKDFILKHFNGYAEVEVVDPENADAVNNLTLDYVPNGFVKNSEDTSEFGYSYTQSKDNQWFSINKSKIDSLTLIDEDNKLEVIEIQNQKYYLSRSEESNAVMWNDGKYVFDITGNISVDELLLIAQKSY